MRSRSWFLAIVLLAMPAIAYAQPSENAVAAEALFEAGRADMEKGDYASACPKFAQSHKLDPAAGTLINLADCEERLGHLAASWLAWREAVERLPLDDARRPVVSERRDAIEKRVPRITVRLGQKVPADAIVKKDDVDLARDLVNVPLPVDPGPHTIVLQARGHVDSRYVVNLAESARDTVTLELGPPDASQPAPTPIPEPEKPQASTPWFGWGVLGLGAVGLGVGATTGILAIGKKTEQEDNCFPIDQCTPVGADAASSGRTFATVSTVSFIVGSVALLAGAYLVFIRGGSKPQPPVAQ